MEKIRYLDFSRIGTLPSRRSNSSKGGFLLSHVVIVDWGQSWAWHAGLWSGGRGRGSTWEGHLCVLLNPPDRALMTLATQKVNPN